MSTKLVIGLDGHGSGQRALEYGKTLAGLIGACELHVVYVIEWSPFSFQTAEENAARHKRREEEIETATSRVVEPAIEALKKDGVNAIGTVRHGNVPDTLNAIANEINASQIVVARSTETGISTRLFGSSTANLVMQASVPVTVVN